MTTLSPSDLLASSDNLTDHLGRLVANLKMEVDEMALEWERLESMGAARDDHAAMLLTRLLPHLEEIGRFSGRCASQIEDARANPYGR